LGIVATFLFKQGKQTMKNIISVIAYLLIIVPCAADTFTNRKTGEVSQGYATQEKKGDKTLVRTGDQYALEYFNLSDYDIEWNNLGRRNQIVILQIKNEIELECETTAFEKAIKVASNQGPLFILIEIDTPGGREDLMKRICDAIISTDNCRTVAFVSGGEYGGAYSAGAVIALACDYIYMANGTAIGAASPSFGNADLSASGVVSEKKILSAARGYIASLAERKGRSGLLAKAMVDSNVAVLEVTEGDKTMFITPEDKTASQTVQHVWNNKGSLLTLTADEAVQCGIANKLLDSEEEIVSEFSLKKPRIIHSQDTIKARAQFEMAKTEVKNSYNDIDYFRKDVSSKLAQYGIVDRLSRDTTYGVSYNGYGYYEHRTETAKPSNQRNQLKSALLVALGNLELKYKGVIALGKANQDLHINIEELNEEVNTIDVLDKNIRANLPYNIPREFTETIVPTEREVDRNY
jgi:hypothetical protein